ncbi:GNAT family N-acetyltransferase [Streptomyces sp. IMTB 2501]|uniref:GNAT family N-acetyltransferase n=1 Tax=Streptomyces sp. IMTB 2501 TaxID=1776340 RepID=UPI0015BE6255|nr:GNAT family N-acetyltransferase [Streptomyces sp. IMTB 2501]
MTRPPLYVRRAVPEDLEVLRRWRREAAGWLAARHGSDQWSKPFRPKLTLALIQQGATMMAMLEPEGEPVATLTLVPHGHPRLWTTDELAVPARYLRKAIVTRAHAGHGIGATLQHWARARAAADGAQVVRLTAWTDNAGLHAYYLDQGRRHVRTVPGIPAGALFENTESPEQGLPVYEVGKIRLPA